MKTKKGLETIFSPILIALLVLIVAFVLIAIFSLKSQIFSKTINSCEQNGGECVISAECETAPLNFECPNKGLCCSKGFGLI